MGLMTSLIINSVENIDEMMIFAHQQSSIAMTLAATLFRYVYTVSKEIWTTPSNTPHQLFLIRL
jgi:hypothetical protein